MPEHPDLTARLGPLTLKNPVLVASGAFGYGREYRDFYDLSRLGGVMVKGTTLLPRAGNSPPRIAETPAGLLNSIGLQNPGVDEVISVELPWLEAAGVTVIVNIAGQTQEEYAEVARRLDDAPGVAGLEVNISCPNVSRGGIAFGTDPAAAAGVVGAVRRATRLPVIVKLSPNVTDIGAIAVAVEEAGADVISLINTLVGMVIDIERRRPLLGNTVGGLSGPAIRPVAVRMVWEVARRVRVPIIGMGGVATAADAIEFILAGAAAVAVGTALFADPMAPLKVIDGIEAYLRRHGHWRLCEIVGAANPGFLGSGAQGAGPS
jgi:dihydroorotate dehydrogenase (NAD+) catalytic subunit